MTSEIAMCPDGKSRSYTVEGEIAIVEVRGRPVEGKITEEDGVTKFRQLAHHHGGHLMYYPPRADEAPG
jgi:hypothetical protein